MKSNLDALLKMPSQRHGDSVFTASYVHIQHLQHATDSLKLEPPLPPRFLGSSLVPA